MRIELREAPDAIRRQGSELSAPIAELVRLLTRQAVHVVVTCARGSSAHAATFGKHLIERHLGIPVAAAAPNIVTLYRQRLQLRDQLFIAISQSGVSDDVVECAAMAKAVGARTVAIVNDTDSALAAACDIILPMAAGPELGVAATKTFVATLGVLLNLAASWGRDGALSSGLDSLPDRLASATEVDWSQALNSLAASQSLMTIGRGPTLAIAREAALKLKETCNLHSEAFSGAEFRHGPISLVSTDYPILFFMPTDAAAAGLHALATDLRLKGASVFMAEHGDAAAGRLPALAPTHPDVDAICLIQSLYALAIDLAERRGTDVDRPRHLKKITRTR